LCALRKTTKASTMKVNVLDEICNREVRILSTGPQRDLLKGIGRLGNPEVQEKVTRKRTLIEYGLRLWIRCDCSWTDLEDFLS
jgi:hypothetical protein